MCSSILHCADDFHNWINYFVDKCEKLSQRITRQHQLIMTSCQHFYVDVSFCRWKSKFYVITERKYSRVLAILKSENSIIWFNE